MSQTVIGMFDEAAEAEQAVQQLISRGFLKDNIDLTNYGSGSGDPEDYGQNESGGISKFFKSLFSSDSDNDNSDKYLRIARHSQSVVTVVAQTKDEAEVAANILDDCGAVNIDDRAASFGYSTPVSATLNRTKETSTTTVPDDKSWLSVENTDLAKSTGATKISILEPNLQVSKLEVLTGSSRISTRVLERPANKFSEFQSGSLVTNQEWDKRASTTAASEHFTAKQFEMTETKEVPVISKVSRIVEEVSISKEVAEKTVKILDTVRNTDVDIENFDSSVLKEKTSFTNTDNKDIQSGEKI